MSSKISVRTQDISVQLNSHLFQYSLTACQKWSQIYFSRETVEEIYEKKVDT